MIELREITWENFWQIISLKPSEHQNDYLPSNAVFMAQAYVNLKLKYPDACFALYNGSHLVGFTKIVYIPKDTGPYNFSEDTYMIDAIMIDAKHQGKGYGSEAFHKVLVYIETKPFGEANSIKLACHDSNVIAIGLYEKAGFCETGQFANREKKLRIYSKTMAK